MSDRLLIHIGYHKTATTWMQYRLFNATNGYRKICTHAEVDALVVRPYGLAFDPAPMQRRIAAALAEMPAALVPVVSSEILSGNPLQGGRESDAFAARLQRIAPEARILVSIRAQMRILPSIYLQYLSRGGTMRAAQFFAGTEEPGYVGFDPAHFEYDRLIGLYRRLFGADRVFVLPQESLLADADAILGRLARFCGNTVFSGLSDRARRPLIASYPEHAVPVLRRLNHLRRSTLNPAPVVNLDTRRQTLYRAAGYLSRTRPVMRLLGRRRRVSDHVARVFAGYFTASNARLKAMLGDGTDLPGYD